MITVRMASRIDREWRVRTLYHKDLAAAMRWARRQRARYAHVWIDTAARPAFLRSGARNRWPRAARV